MHKAICKYWAFIDWEYFLTKLDKEDVREITAFIDQKVWDEYVIEQEINKSMTPGKGTIRKV